MLQEIENENKKNCGRQGTSPEEKVGECAIREKIKLNV